MEKRVWKTTMFSVICMAVGVGMVMLFLCLWREYANASADEQTRNLAGFKILIDPGHGGRDGGAVGGAQNACEAEINLDISKKLQNLLAEKGAQVVLTREDKNAVGKSKNEDMQNRRTMIRTAGQDITVSIHQNSFPDPSVCGPQAIYLAGSEQGEKLAICIQNRLNEELEPARPRSAADGNYFILKSGEAPAVIVECGFLSNASEEALLLEDAYQKRVAQAIALGIADYLAG